VRKRFAGIVVTFTCTLSNDRWSHDAGPEKLPACVAH
jgi:hypothetical protein